MLHLKRKVELPLVINMVALGDFWVINIMALGD